MLPYACALLLSFLVTLLSGSRLIPFLRRLKAGQSIREDGPTWHMGKQGTPTMGGLMFILGTAAAVAVGAFFAPGDLTGLFAFLFALIFGAIGCADDMVKIRKKHNEGLTAAQKFLLQLAAAVAFVSLLRYLGYLRPDLYIPFFNVSLHLSWWLYTAFSAFAIVATVNAVNLTDGIDGLAAGVTLPVMLFFAAAALLWGYAAVGSLAAGLAGGLIAFLVYNFHPARVFMGDTGSLFLGGAVCGLAFALDMPLIILAVGLVYVLEALSDVIQVAYFKATHGKRIFRMAPLHHHFEMGGWSEVKLFCVFTGVTALMCVLAWFGIAGRYPV